MADLKAGIFLLIACGRVPTQSYHVHLSLYVYMHIYIYLYKYKYSQIFIGGTLEVKFPTMWRDGEAEVGRAREEKRNEEKRREEK